MITLTPIAVEKIKDALTAEKEQSGLRITVTGSESSGLKFRMNLEKDAGNEDEVLNIGGISLFVDKHSLVFLTGTRIDYVDSEEGSGFKFEKPTATPGCGCGETFEA